MNKDPCPLIPHQNAILMGFYNFKIAIKQKIIDCYRDLKYFV